MIRKYIKRRLQGEFKARRSIIRTNEEYRIIQKRNKQIQEGMSSCFFFFFRPRLAAFIVGTGAPSAVFRCRLPSHGSVFLRDVFLLHFLFGTRALSCFRFPHQERSLLLFSFFERIHPSSASGALFCFLLFLFSPAGKSLPEEGKRGAFQKRRKRRKMGRK